jgi:hypothetical protein
MAERKYGKYVVKIPLESGEFGPLSRLTGEEHYASDFSILFAHISAPCLMEDAPHSHDFDMYLYFLGVNDLGDMDAEIEMGLGEEQEIHKITTPTSVYIPKGLVHCPLNFRRVGKPILFVHATLAPKYIKASPQSQQSV